MKYLKTIIFMFSVLFIFNFILTILYYFNIISSSFNSILKYIIFVITFISSGIYIGRRSNKKGWIEGLKISLIVIPIFLLISIIFGNKINIFQILYYIICSVVIVIGSMIGINYKLQKK